MDFRFSEQDNAFLEEVRAFLDANLSLEFITAGERTIETYCDFEVSRKWLKVLAGKGWAVPGWPVEYGGTGWSIIQHYIFKRELARAGAPKAFNNHPASCVIHFGTDEQKARFLPPIRDAETIWAQGYSEPSSGSDLASLKTRAVVDGDDYVVNGSKIWTTFAHHADWLFCLVRTSTEGRKQQGITFLLIDLRSPGVEIKPIINLAGQHDFNQVFFTDVRVPQANRIGPENEGWTVGKYFLAFEHMGDGAARLRRRLDRVRHIASLQRADDGGTLVDDPDVARRLNEIAVGIEALDAFELRLASALSRGDAPGPEGSAAKIRNAALMQQLTEMGMQAMGYYGFPYEPEMLAVACEDAPVAPAYGFTETLRYFMKRGETIYGGSDEVQRNILAKRKLGF